MTAEAASPMPRPMDAGDLLRLADDLVAAGAPGAAVMVVDERGPQQAASGVADLAAGRPMQPDLRFRFVKQIEVRWR
jgi:CubicO group peptidase (beta-lactamase class C family)